VGGPCWWLVLVLVRWRSWLVAGALVRLYMVAVLRFRCWIGHEHILLGSKLASWTPRSL
jgi:hypothetical protein